MIPETKKKLIEEIRKAFLGVKLDGGIGLSEADAMDDYKDLMYITECKKKDEAFFWDNISSVELNKHYCGLSFFDAKGMKFHLPAFLIAELNGEYRFNFIFTLINLSDYSKVFILLSKEQKSVVKLFLEYFLDGPHYDFEKQDIKKAIEDYWSF